MPKPNMSNITPPTKKTINTKKSTTKPIRRQYTVIKIKDWPKSTSFSFFVLVLSLKPFLIKK
jgi:hypothetical protein